MVFIKMYSGISIKRTHHKAETSIRRTVWRGTDCFALRSNYLRKNLYKADISMKRTLFLHQWCPLYRDSTVIRIYNILQKTVGSTVRCQKKWELNHGNVYSELKVGNLLNWAAECSAKSINKLTQTAFTCSKLTIEALEQGVKYVQS